MNKETMNINLSKTEIQALLVALKHTQNFQDEDRELDRDRRLEGAQGTCAWIERQAAATDLTEKLSKALDTDTERQARNKRMMKGTTTAVVSETLCGNDPVNW
jgi:hypothetical protein